MYLGVGASKHDTPLKMFLILQTEQTHWETLLVDDALPNIAIHFGSRLSSLRLMRCDAMRCDALAMYSLTIWSTTKFMFYAVLALWVS